MCQVWRLWGKRFPGHGWSLGPGIPLLSPHFYSIEANQDVIHFPSQEARSRGPVEPSLLCPWTRSANSSREEEAIYFVSAPRRQGAAQSECVCGCRSLFLYLGPRVHNGLEEDQSHPQGEKKKAKAPGGSWGRAWRPRITVSKRHRRVTQP